MSDPGLIQGMFFDLDGTLCNTDEANFKAYSAALKDSGYIISWEDFSKTIGLRADSFIPMLAPGISKSDVKKVMVSKANYYKDMMHMVRPNNQLIDFLKTMRGHHVMALVTTAKRKNATNVLQTAGILELFDIMVFGDEVEHAKPHPEAYLKALRESALENHQVIAFEDSEVGIKAAVAAGISVVRVLS